MVLCMFTSVFFTAFPYSIRCIIAQECTKCHQTIEKNGGCNHMTCRNEACKYEFCWTCMGPWEPHGSSWYTCNRFDEADSKDARETAAVCLLKTEHRTMGFYEL